jgi:glycosyltransferase involved in cell wall biosynthesis
MNELKLTSHALLTAIIPVTDVRNRIATIETWVNQLPSNIQICFLFILDSKSDSEKFEFRKFISTLSGNHFQLIEVDYNSPGLSRNEGLVNARTPWVCFWDSDDIPVPVEALSAVSEAGSAEVLIGKYKNLDYNSNLTENFTSNDFTIEDIFARNPGLWRFIFLRSTLGDARFSNFRMAEDQLFLCHLDLGSKKIQFTPRVVYNYVNHSNTRLTNSFNAIRDLRMVQRDLIKLMSNKSNTISLLVLIRITVTGIRNLAPIEKFKMLKYLFLYSCEPKNFIPILRAISIILVKRISR